MSTNFSVVMGGYVPVGIELIQDTRSLNTHYILTKPDL